MHRMFSKWRLGNLKQYLFFKKVILENKFSHMFVEPKCIIKIGKTSVMCRKPKLKINNFDGPVFSLSRPNLPPLPTSRLKC